MSPTIFTGGESSMSVGWPRKTSRAAWHIEVISVFFRHSDLLTFPVYPTSSSRWIISSRSSCLSAAAPFLAPFDMATGSLVKLLVEPGVGNGELDVDRIAWPGMSRGGGFESKDGEMDGEVEGPEEEEGVSFNADVAFGEEWVSELWPCPFCNAPLSLGGLTLIFGLPSVCEEVAVPLAVSGAEVRVCAFWRELSSVSGLRNALRSALESLPPLRVFLDCCWPMGRAALGRDGDPG